jgi:hypothetical protein
VAIHTVTPASLSPQPSIITSKQISRYAELAALVSQLDAQQKALRLELLALRAAGAEQENTSPYLLAFIDQQRRQIDWQSEAMALAMRVYGTDQLTAWKTRLEQSAPVQPITQIRVKPNPAFAAGLHKPAATVRMPLNLGGNQTAVASGD